MLCNPKNCNIEKTYGCLWKSSKEMYGSLWKSPMENLWKDPMVIRGNLRISLNYSTELINSIENNFHRVL